MKTAAKSKAPLADRIAMAVRGKPTSEEVASLISESEEARAEAEERQLAARASALDPSAGSDVATAARRESDDLQFEMDRLDTALGALREALQRAKYREVDAKRREAYDAAKAERDALIEELKEVYPELEQRLADLIGRLAANNAVLERVNRNLPDSGTALKSADEIARGGREKFGGYQEFLDRRLTRLRLPRFVVNRLDPYAWPSQSPRIGRAEDH